MMAGALGAAASAPAKAQTPIIRRVGNDSVLVIAGEIYRAGSLHRKLLGDNYRFEWTTPITVRVLDLKTFHGGLEPTKEGGGKQAPSLRLVAPDSSEYVFRMVRKIHLILGPEFEHTVVWYIVRDEGSASHPTGALAAAPIAATLDLLHATPKLYYMPDDPALGKFRKDFGGVLGMVEEYPTVPDAGKSFAGAQKIIDSDTLLGRLNADPKTRVDARALLTARLMDMLIGDNDRHPDQWKWARFSKGDDAVWEPIGRDRDKAFVSYGGFIPRLARFVYPNLVTYRASYPDPQGLFANAGEFDRRALGSLDRNVWDSVATSIMQRISDQVIDNAVATMPPEYTPSSKTLAATIKARRNGLRGAADRYYSELWRVADIQGTDADDQAAVTRAGDGIVDVVIQSGNDPPYFSRRFLVADTKEIRIYLHGGNDRATVTGSVRSSIPVRIIGGNGTNTFTDLSTVGGRRNPTRFYDQGTVENVKYAPDTVDERINLDDAFNHSFNRRPWVHANGTLLPPSKDRGSSLTPVAKLHSQRRLGIYPELGATHYSYGFRDVPYSQMIGGTVSYSVASNRWRVRGYFDKRFEESGVHIPVDGYMSEFQVVQFKGFGNNVPDLKTSFYDVHQRQWQFRPGVGLSPNPVSDISIGPVVRYTTTDSVGNRFISQLRPYGFTKFGQAGVQLRAHFDNKWMQDTLKPRFTVDLTGNGYPAMWDVAKAYESVDGWATAFFTFPIAKKPVLAFRAGGKKLWGDFPYFDAAFVGGSETLRTEELQRYAGDASLYGTTELRVPVAKFPFILPLDVGLIGFGDAARVYVKGDSPGGWHSAAGGGFWVGAINPAISVSLLFTNSSTHHVVSSIGFAF